MAVLSLFQSKIILSRKSPSTGNALPGASGGVRSDYNGPLKLESYRNLYAPDRMLSSSFDIIVFFAIFVDKDTGSKLERKDVPHRRLTYSKLRIFLIEQRWITSTLALEHCST